MLSDRDRAVLEFEIAHRPSDGLKQDRVRKVFDLSYPRYYQLVNAIIDLPDALLAYPLEVKQLLNARQRRLARRASRRFAPLLPHADESETL